MSNALFATLESSLCVSEKVVFTLEKGKNDQLMLTVQPVLDSQDESTMSTEIQQARAALATPLVIKMSGAEADAQFVTMLADFEGLRTEINASYLLLMENMSEAVKSSKVAASKTGTAQKVVKPDAKETTAKEEGSETKPPAQQVDQSSTNNPDTLL